MTAYSERTLVLLARMPRWFRVQALAVAVAPVTPPAGWPAPARRREPEKLEKPEMPVKPAVAESVKPDAATEWQDTVATFNER